MMKGAENDGRASDPVGVTWALWNDELMPLDEVRVPALDRGFLFGDAVYEVVRVYGGRAWLLHEHVERLRRSLHELRIPLEPRVEDVAAKVERLVRRSGVTEGGLYLQVTRGVAPRSHVPVAGMRPNELAYLQALPPDYMRDKRARGVSVRTGEDQRWGRCDVKSTNLLGNCLAAMRAKDEGFDEAVLVGRDGAITEGSHTSVFFIKRGALLTTPLTANILPGITRELVVGLARNLGLSVTETSVAARDVSGMDEIFLCGTLSEIYPVVRWDDLIVGSGQPGVVTKRLQVAFGKALSDWQR